MNADVGNIRPAGEADLSRIGEILVFGKRVAYRDYFRDDVGSFRELQVLDVAEDYRAHRDRLSHTLVYDDGIVRGLLTWQDTQTPGQRELQALYIDPFFTGQGIGSALLAAFLHQAAAHGRTSLQLWVIRDNENARRFYARHGFAPDGQARLVEGTQVPELRYSRELCLP